MAKQKVAKNQGKYKSKIQLLSPGSCKGLPISRCSSALKDWNVLSTLGVSNEIEAGLTLVPLVVIMMEFDRVSMAQASAAGSGATSKLYQKVG